MIALCDEVHKYIAFLCCSQTQKECRPSQTARFLPFSYSEIRVSPVESNVADPLVISQAKLVPRWNDATGMHFLHLADCLHIFAICTLHATYRLQSVRSRMDRCRIPSY